MEPISREAKLPDFLPPEDDGFLLGISIDIPAPVVATVTDAVESSGDTVPSIQIPDKLYFRIGDVADLAQVKPYVLRYWESEFPMITPEKSTTGQRVYRRSDVETILLIKHLLYLEKYSIEGARKRIQELRREGQLKAFKQDKIYGGHDAALARERLKLAREIASELDDLAKLPLRELFRY